jgi:transcription termination factor NusB
MMMTARKIIEEKRKTITSKIQPTLEWATKTFVWLDLLVQNIVQEIPYELI